MKNLFKNCIKKIYIWKSPFFPWGFFIQIRFTRLACMVYKFYEVPAKIFGLFKTTFYCSKFVCTFNKDYQQNPGSLRVAPSNGKDRNSKSAPKSNKEIAERWERSRLYMVKIIFGFLIFWFDFFISQCLMVSRSERRNQSAQNIK